MKIGSISENLNFEKRIAITPEIAKKFIENGFEINLQKIMQVTLVLKIMIMKC